MTKRAAPRIVGVICSRIDLERALRMRTPPDFFELRLDMLVPSIRAPGKAVEKLPAPVIVTARHPREAGANQLSSRERRDLLLGFLSQAAYVDVELRSVRALAAVLRAAKANRVPTIVSFHDFRGTPSASRLDEIARAAESLGPEFIKIATRTDTEAQLTRLLDFFERQTCGAKIVAMGIGKLGRSSRLHLARRGCALNYAHLGKAQVPGQLSMQELRAALR